MLQKLCFTVTMLLALLAPSFQQDNLPPTFINDLRAILVTQGISEAELPGIVIGRLSCSDPEGDTIQYYKSSTNSFRVDTNGTVILTQQLDRESSVNTANPTAKPNTVRFECVDIYPGNYSIPNLRNRPRRPDRTFSDLDITVIDANDNAPVFTVELAGGFSFDVKEDAVIGQPISGIITITDNDLGTNANLFSLNITCDNDPEPCQKFGLKTPKQVKEGVYTTNLEVRAQLDYETKVAYRTKLQAVDGNGNGTQLTTIQGIRIQVIDSQDTNPYFTNQNYNFDVYEGTPINSLVNFSLSAIDGDTGAQRAIKLDILKGNYNLLSVDPAVQVDNLRGYQAQLRVAAEIDREMNSSFLFTAKAWELDDSRNITNATATATFTMHILDINDNCPSFKNQTYTVSMPEVSQQNNGTQVPDLDIEVTDADEALYAHFRLEIVSQTFSGSFGFTPNNDVTNNAHFYLVANTFQYLDYEDERNRLQTVVLRAVELGNTIRTCLGPSSTATVTIKLTDINDNFPLFSQETYFGSIIENTPPNTSILRVVATDVDSGDNGKVRYRLENRIANTFAINPTTGEITLLSTTLNYWTQNVYTFQVFADDMATNTKTNAAYVTIQITDYNNEKPVFTLPVYTAVVTEFQTQFQSRVQVQARDEKNATALITYSIIAGNTPDNKFVIGITSGELSLSTGLNYEETVNKSGQIILTIAASDNGAPPQTSTCLITVTVIDVNNFDPVFNPTTYTTTISEAVPKGTFVTTMTATDRDFGANGRVSYRIGTGSRDNFVVFDNGSIYISNFPTFDYDVYKSLSVQIIAIDGGSPQKTATATLYVTVTDANNKSPQFLDSLYTAVINESTPVGASVLTVSASDIDTVHLIHYYINRNSIIAISQSGIRTESTFLYDYRNTFAVDLITGVVRVSQNLNRNYVVEFIFDVEARDEHPSAIGTQIATSNVQITISGMPDRDLYFLQPWTKDNPVYTIPILESSPIGTKIMTLIARDPVDQSNLRLYSQIMESDNGNYFQVTNVDGTPGVVLLLKNLDYESRDLIHSTVVTAEKTASVNGVSTIRSVTATISIIVQDFNDNPPRFTRSQYAYQVSESLTINSFVGEARATDADSSSFGPITFSLGGGLGREDFKLFQPPNDEGVVQILVAVPKLDYETRKEYTLELIAKDNANNAGSQIQLTGTSILKITLTDENDNTPNFTDPSRSFSVPETAAIQTRLGQIIAVDGDSGTNGLIVYTLQSDPSAKDNALGLFRITEDGGVLLTRSSLRGFSGGYSMYVVATDRGSPSRSASIPIIIKVQGAEDDDGTPQWRQPVNNYIVYVTEHNKTKLDVTFLALARTANSSVSYIFNSQYRPEDNSKFRIDSSTGDVYVIGDLDRELQDEYSLIIQATDIKNLTMISWRTLYVRLIDIPDNLPSFAKSNYTACPNNFPVPKTYFVIDKTPAGTIVGRAEACDPDGPGNNIIYYSIYTGNSLCRQWDSGNFIVNKNGSIVTKVVLNYEVQPEYLVCVKLDQLIYTRRRRAIDRAQMIDTSKVAYVVISIDDVNDNAPTFKNTTNTALVETVPTENFVAQVTADDPDGPLYSQIKYDIIDTVYFPPGRTQPYSMRGAFSINPDNGIITADLLTYEDFARGYFVLTVAAYDYNNNAFNDTMNMKVIVHQQSQVLRIVLNKAPSQGIQLAPKIIAKLNEIGAPQRTFFFTSSSEHRSASGAQETQTDICFVLVDNSLGRAYDPSEGLAILDYTQFKAILIQNEYSFIDRGTCYQMLASQGNVKWRDLWWVLVAIALFMFVCIVILIVTICILYDRYKSYFDTERTYLVPQ